jgi:hypothetical protein
MSQPADYSFWENALEGVIGPVTEDSPQPGFYRLRSDAGNGKRGAAKFIDAKAVAIFELDGAVMASVDGMMANDPSELFLACCKWPVEESWYRQHRAGKGWPDINALGDK